MDIHTKNLENDRLKMYMERMEFRDEMELQEKAQSSVFSLLMVLICTTIDEERTILGSEPFKVPVLTGRNRDIAINKLMQQIQAL